MAASPPEQSDALYIQYVANDSWEYGVNQPQVCIAICFGQAIFFYRLEAIIQYVYYYNYYYIYLSAHVQRTKQALGFAPHEALFKKKQTHTKSLLRHYKELLTVTQTLIPHLSDRHPHSSFLACAIQDHCQLIIIICCFKLPPSLGALDPFYQFFSLILPSCTL